MDKVFSIVRQIYGRSPTYDMNDLDVNNNFWGIFMNVTLQAAIHLGRDHLENLQFTKKQLQKSAKQLFQVTEMLNENQQEINNLTTIDYQELTSSYWDYECRNLCLRRLGALSGKYQWPTSRSLEEQN